MKTETSIRTTDTISLRQLRLKDSFDKSKEKSWTDLNVFVQHDSPFQQCSQFTHDVCNSHISLLHNQRKYILRKRFLLSFTTHSSFSALIISLH